jgi:hypothetical protein
LHLALRKRRRRPDSDAAKQNGKYNSSYKHKDVYPKSQRRRTSAQGRRPNDLKGTQYSDSYGKQLLRVWLISSNPNFESQAPNHIT